MFPDAINLYVYMMMTRNVMIDTFVLMTKACLQIQLIYMFSILMARNVMIHMFCWPRHVCLMLIMVSVLLQSPKVSLDAISLSYQSSS